MANRILDKSAIADGICRFKIEAPRIARKRKAGNFVIVRANEFAERIPLTIVDSDTEDGSITLIVQSVGKSTRLLNSLNAGDELADVIGPLGLKKSSTRWKNSIRLSSRLNNSCFGRGGGNAVACTSWVPTPPRPSICKFEIMI